MRGLARRNKLMPTLLQNKNARKTKKRKVASRDKTTNKKKKAEREAYVPSTD